MTVKKPSLKASLLASRQAPGPHPDRLELLELTLDELDSSRAALVREHAAACPRCQGILKSLLEMPARGDADARLGSKEKSDLWASLSRHLGGTPGEVKGRGEIPEGGGGTLTRKV